MASDKESSLLSALEYSNSQDIYSLFSDYLHPFSDLTKQKKPKTTTKQKQQEQTLILRSLAKQYLQFINKCLSIIPKRLSNQAKETQENTFQLFDVYKLCLDCLELVSSQLSCKPYTMQLQRTRLLSCLMARGRYGDAESEGFGILEKLRGHEVGTKKKDLKRVFLPKVVEDAELGMLVVKVVEVIVRCVAMGQTKDAGEYKRVIDLVVEVKPWFRVVDSSGYELHRNLVIYMGKCALFLVGELMYFDSDFVRAFCVATLSEYAKEPMKDQLYKFAHRVCSSLYSLEEKKILHTVDVLICVFDTLACASKVEMDKSGTDFVEFVSYYANKCRIAGNTFCRPLARYLNEIAGRSSQITEPFNLFLRLYASGLYHTIYDVKSKLSEVTSANGTKDESSIKTFFVDKDEWHILEALLGLLGNYFQIDCEVNCAPYTDDHKDSSRQTPLEMTNGASLSWKQKNKKAYMLSYLNALKFLCQPLADMIYSEKKEILSETEGSFDPLLCVVQDAFHQFCDAYHSFLRCSSKEERAEFDDNKTILSVTLASYIISIRTQLKVKKSTHLMKGVIATESIQPHALKYLFSSLYNIGVVLYRNKQLKESSKALKLCFTASWTCVSLLCQKFGHNSEGSDDELAEKQIVQFVTEVCNRCAFFLDVLQQFGIHKIQKVIKASLASWSMARCFFGSLPGPMPIVKHWVKMQCKHNNIVNAGKHLSLYSFLPSSLKVSKTIGIVLEQELLAYEEKYPLYPEICQRMQFEIIDILLQDIYITQDDWLHKSRILLRKGKAWRAAGVEHAKDCIQCFSDTIVIMSDMSQEASGTATTSCHLLAVAYCLRALCTQETEPNSKQIFQDIKAALNLWLRITISGDFCADGESSMLPENTMLLLYNIVDLLSLKGCIDLHHDIYKLIFRLFKRRNVQSENILAMLLECRRLSHALCVSPVNEDCIQTLSEYYGEPLKSLDFWICCLKESHALQLGFKHNFSFLLSTATSASYYSHGSPFQADITVAAVRKAASELVSSIPLTMPSAFLAGGLYYDLCERLISNGRLSEALSCANEAHRLRTQHFQEKFKYSVEPQVEKYNAAGVIVEKRSFGLRNFRVFKSVASEVWYFDTVNRDINACYFSPWIVLQCFLESTLQIGIVNEMIGNGAEAESFLLWGKEVACSQSLSLFIVAFGSVLGRLYRKKGLLDLAEKELEDSKLILVSSGNDISCSKCRLMLEVNVDQQLGDLARSYSDSASDCCDIERLSHAESLYKSVQEKLSLCELKTCINCLKGANDGHLPARKSHGKDLVYGVCNSSFCSAANQSHTREVSVQEGPKVKGSKNCRKTNNASKLLLKEKGLKSQCSSRLTRSRCQTSMTQNLTGSIDMQSGVSKDSTASVVSNHHPVKTSKSGSLGEAKSLILGTSFCARMRCWLCICKDVVESGLLKNFISLKWEFIRRRLLLRVLSSLGKCLKNHRQTHYAHELMLHSISVLFGRDLSSHSGPSDYPLLDFIWKEFSGDVFCVERATILYNISWYSLMDYPSKDLRTVCCALSGIQIEKVVSYLKLAFVLCREVPVLFQKVSRLLAAIYLLSASKEEFTFSPSCSTLSENHWASYFHQASLGTQISYQFFSDATHKGPLLKSTEGSNAIGSTCLGSEPLDLPRLAPDSVNELEKFVNDFFMGLPCTPVICISFFGGASASLLQKLLLYPSRVCAWMLLSRLNSRSQPVVMLLPVDSVLHDDDANFSSVEVFDGKDMNILWRCPWGSTLIDVIAPSFKLILEENYLSTTHFPIEDNKKNRSLWWTRRKNLDQCLGRLLRNLEESWLGPWRYVLLGEWSNCKLDSVLENLVHDLKSKCKVDANETLLKVILGGGLETFSESCIAHLSLKNGCYISTMEYSDEDNCRTPSTTSIGAENLSGLALQLIHEAMSALAENENRRREPIILVLDTEVQMLPWENIPILRDQEVYRMPSVGSISATLDKNREHQEQGVQIGASFPLIDPLDAFYLLNPGGDLRDTQLQFESWFRDENLEGKAGSPPTAQELAVALKSHDLYIYFGHGSGAQYISAREVQKLEKCAATFLMGCSSGSLSLNGCYIPQGTPLSYLLAGSPAIVANLWEVTDRDIDRFGKAMLDAWLKERSKPVGCEQCSSIAKEFAAMSIAGNNNGKKKISKKKSTESCKSDLSKKYCDHRPKIGSFMSQARNACTLPYLIGAAPVCYGVPTGIHGKNNI